MNKLLIVTSAVALLTALAGPAYADHNEKTVFVTSVSFNGNLGGLTGADDKCQAQADGPASVVPSGTYLAWLSDGTDSPATRFTKSAHPYMLPDGSKIAEDFTDLTDGSILHPIDIDTTGEPVGSKRFWTGTNADGTKFSSRTSVACAGWTADPLANFYGVAGRTHLSSGLWSSKGRPYLCTRTYRLACFQQ